ncbi:MAG: helix-turn-helix transcriptional regulator [Halobacteriovoraceae bacterium]|nr:helix-turn-helix transcriptional regulator [Halobacteriovoraceae bacterium]MCB9061880.1 helix-turn-helix transcriptional regulator [Halobacteriovoraceae bacterium]
MKDILDLLVPEDSTSGEIVRAYRKCFGMTLKDLEKLTGIKMNNLSAIENDRVELTVKSASKIAAALGSHPQDLLFPNGDFKKSKDIKKIERSREKFLRQKDAI